jgi:hypothetical protein
MAAPAHIARENERRADDPRGTSRARKFATTSRKQRSKRLVADTKAAETGNTLNKFLLEMIYGKAPQQLEVGGLEGEPLSASLSASDRRLLTDVRNLLKQPRAK